MLKLENVAMPRTGGTVAVPPSVPAAGFVPIAMVMGVVAPATTLPLTSSMATCTAGEMDLLTRELEGCAMNFSWVGVVAMLKAALIVPVKPVAAAVSV